jgi:hypothetical protein
METEAASERWQPQGADCPGVLWETLQENKGKGKEMAVTKPATFSLLYSMI